MNSYQDRAKKISALLWGTTHPSFAKKNMEIIASELRTVMDEVKAETILRMGQLEHAAHVEHACPGCRQKAKSEAYEDAARIADDWGNIGSHPLARECGKQVAETIRARAKEMCK